LSNRASERFKSQAQHLISSLDLQLAHEFEDWQGNLEVFEGKILPIIEDYFELHYKDYFKLSRPKLKEFTRRERELKKMENRVKNVIESITKGDEKFYLKEIVEMIDEKNKDLVIEAIESLIEKELIIPSS